MVREVCEEGVGSIEHLYRAIKPDDKDQFTSKEFNLAITGFGSLACEPGDTLCAKDLSTVFVNGDERL